MKMDRKLELHIRKRAALLCGSPSQPRTAALCVFALQLAVFPEGTVLQGEVNVAGIVDLYYKIQFRLIARYGSKEALKANLYEKQCENNCH